MKALDLQGTLKALDKGQKVCRVGTNNNHLFQVEDKFYMEGVEGDIMEIPYSYLTAHPNIGFIVTDGFRDFSGCQVPLQIGKKVRRSVWKEDAYLYKPDIFIYLNEEQSLKTNLYMKVSIDMTNICMVIENVIVDTNYKPESVDLMSHDWYVVQPRKDL